MMHLALLEAQKAAAAGEVPVGAIVVCEGKVISKAYNQPISKKDPSAHAEVLALREAALYFKNYRLPDCELYVTLEPCMMCVGAIIQARLKNVYFGAFDPKTGAAGSVINLFDTSMNHHTSVQGGILKEECALLLKEFFAQKRVKS